MPKKEKGKAMARVMEKVVPVKVIGDEANAYATIIRSMISATTAALRLKEYDAAESFALQKDWANDEYNKCLDRAKGQKK